MGKYLCIFDPKQECPVKTEYKLKPESLVEFCKICNVNQRDARKIYDRINDVENLVEKLKTRIVALELTSQQTTFKTETLWENHEKEITSGFQKA